MHNNSEPNSFSYTYSAEQREKVLKIRSKYVPNQETPMDQLLRLDAGVTRKATVRALILGCLGALIMGCGMSLVMTDLAQSLSLSQNTALIAGIAIGIVGLAIASCAYPVYQHTVTKERQRISPEILRLTDELMQ